MLTEGPPVPSITPKAIEMNMWKKSIDFLLKYGILINILITTLLLTVVLFLAFGEKSLLSRFSEYTGRVVDPSLNLIDEQNKALISAHNEHAKYCQVALTKVKNNTDDTLDLLKQEASLLSDMVSLQKDQAGVMGMVAPKKEVPVTEEKSIPEKQKETKNVKVEEKCGTDVEFALLPASDDKTNVEKMKSDLRILIRKHNVVLLEDIDNMPYDRYILWLKDYEKFVANCEKGYYKKGFWNNLW